MDIERVDKGTVASFKDWPNIKQDGVFQDSEIVNKKTFDFQQQEASERTLENVNANELKNIAIKLLPTIDKIKLDGISNLDIYTKLANDAIEYAFTFEEVWNKKIQED